MGNGVEPEEIGEILFDERTIAERTGRLASRISQDYAGKELVLVCVMKGALMFFADLARAVTLPVIVDCIHVSSYGCATSSSGSVLLQKDLETDITGKHVLLVDTIIDTGKTLNRLFTLFAQRGPASIDAAVLLDKRSRRTADVSVSYTGFQIEDRFVVGYGMDCGERYRNLPYITVLRPAE